MKNKILYSILLSALALKSFGLESQNHLTSHSVKTLNVVGTPMALIQLFIPGDHIKVKVKEEKIGISKVGNKLSLYIDMADLNSESRTLLENLGYSRKSEEIKKVLSMAFKIKNDRNSVHFSLKN